MTVKIEINTDGYPVPDKADLECVVATEIQELEDVLNALEAKKSEYAEKHSMLKKLQKMASRPRTSSE